jgi:hypothetical protein
MAIEDQILYDQCNDCRMEILVGIHREEIDRRYWRDGSPLLDGQGRVVARRGSSDESA